MKNLKQISNVNESKLTFVKDLTYSEKMELFSSTSSDAKMYRDEAGKDVIVKRRYVNGSETSKTFWGE